MPALQRSLPPHENVVGCHGGLLGGPQGTEGGPQGTGGGPGEVLLLLEYCSGGSLLDLLQRTKRPQDGLQESVIRRVLLHVARLGFRV